MTIGSRHARLAAAAVFSAVLAACQPEAAETRPEPARTDAPVAARVTVPLGSGFDFLVLALSWSPSYCEAEGANANRQQCAVGKDHAFVVHGLWPQFEKGWPEFCVSREPDRVPDALVRRYSDLIPSAGLVGHQWRKHGSCSGLSQADYLALTRLARERIEVPDRFEAPRKQDQVSPAEVEAAFTAANPGLPRDGIAVTCEGGLLREVRICMTKDLDFRACAGIDARGCRLPRAAMPAPG